MGDRLKGCGTALVTYDNATTQFDDKCLENLAYGNQPFFAFQKSLYAGQREHFQRVNAICQPFGIATALDELVNHAYVSDAYDVQRTDYSSGAAAIINLGRQVYQPDRGPADHECLPTVPPRGFLLRFPDGRIQVGQIETTVRLHDDRGDRP